MSDWKPRLKSALVPADDTFRRSGHYIMLRQRATQDKLSTKLIPTSDGEFLVIIETNLQRVMAVVMADGEPAKRLQSDVTFSAPHCSVDWSFDNSRYGWSQSGPTYRNRQLPLYQVAPWQTRYDVLVDRGIGPMVLSLDDWVFRVDDNSGIDFLNLTRATIEGPPTNPEHFIYVVQLFLSAAHDERCGIPWLGTSKERISKGFYDIETDAVLVRSVRKSCRLSFSQELSFRHITQKPAMFFHGFGVLARGDRFRQVVERWLFLREEELALPVISEGFRLIKRIVVDRYGLPASETKAVEKQLGSLPGPVPDGVVSWQNEKEGQTIRGIHSHVKCHNTWFKATRQLRNILEHDEWHDAKEDPIMGPAISQMAYSIKIKIRDMLWDWILHPFTPDQAEEPAG